MALLLPGSSSAGLYGSLLIAPCKKIQNQHGIKRASRKCEFWDSSLQHRLRKG